MSGRPSEPRPPAVPTIDALLAAQKDYADGGAFPELLSIYHLFGDPGMRLR